MKTTSSLAMALAFAVVAMLNDRAMAQEETATGSDERIVLFDGSNLDHWRGWNDEAIGEGWKIDGDVLVFDGTEGSGDLMTRQSWSDFQLDFEWAVTEGGNSGVMYRVVTGERYPFLTGPEYQILDDDRHADGKSDLTSAASLYALYPPVDASLQPVGEWNRGRIVVQGNRVEHWLNGACVVEAEIGSDDWTTRVADSKFRDWKKFAASSEGHICLQDHGDEVRFRNISLLPLPK